MKGWRQDDKRPKTGWQDGEDEGASCHCLRNSWLGSSYSRCCRRAPKNLNNTILYSLTESCKCKSSIEVIFYGAAEVLQQDAIDLIYLATTWDYNSTSVELSLFYPVSSCLHWSHARKTECKNCKTKKTAATTKKKSPIESTLVMWGKCKIFWCFEAFR